MRARTRRTTWTVLVAVVVLFATGLSSCGNAGSGSTQAGGGGGGPRVEIRLAGFDDPQYEAVLYGIKSGEVTSDKVDVKVEYLTVPGLTEAMNSGQYDIVEAPSIAVPKLANAGAPVKIIGPSYTLIGDMNTYAVIVPANSPIKTYKDLAGKKLAVEATAASNTLVMRMGIAKSAGLNMAQTGGDVTFREMPAATTPTALLNGDVDAAFVYYATFYKLKDDPAFRSIGGSPHKLYADALKTKPRVTVRASFQPIIDKKGDALEAALALIEKSRQYYVDNQAKIDKLVAEKRNIAVAYMAWVNQGVIVGGAATKDELRSDLEIMYRTAVELKDLPAAPNMQSLFWTR